MKERQRCGTNASPGLLFFYEKTGQSGMKKRMKAQKFCANSEKLKILRNPVKNVLHNALIVLL